MPCHVSVLNLFTSGHVTRSQTSGFFNKQKRSNVVNNLQFLMLNLFNSSIKMYHLYFAKVNCPYFRVCTRKSGMYRKSVEIQRYPEIRCFLLKIMGNVFHHLFYAFESFWNQLFCKNTCIYIQTKNAFFMFNNLSCILIQHRGEFLLVTYELISQIILTFTIKTNIQRVIKCICHA